jgi:pyruvate formate lyase activating enzyme
MKEAILYEKLEKKRVQCHVCNHHCTILPNKRGICGVRENQDGILYSLVYGRAISEAIDPIEKKPFFHFLPGSTALSIATVGCNFRCDNCQNWEISQASKLSGYTDLKISGENLPPTKVVADALDNNCASIAYTYTEPTIWLEYALDCMKLASQKNLKNVWVSNGYMSDKTVKKILPYLDAINIDLKFFDNINYQKNCGAKLEPILNNLKTFKKMGVWLEITTLSIPTLSDSQDMFTAIARFIKKELGAATPWHISSFSGQISYKLQDLPDTPQDTLGTAVAIARKEGLQNVYAGNAPGLNLENTYCPHCQTEVIARHGYLITRHDNKGRCPKCHKKLSLIIE